MGRDTAKPIYGIGFPVQRNQIGAWCWGSCGHGQIAAVDVGPCHAILCHEPACPHLDKDMSESIGEIDGRPLIMRKLQPVPKGNP